MKSHETLQQLTTMIFRMFGIGCQNHQAAVYLSIFRTCRIDQNESLGAPVFLVTILLLVADKSKLFKITDIWVNFF